MNISNLSSVTGNSQQAAWLTPSPQDTSTDGTSSKPHATHHHHHGGRRAAEATETSSVPDIDGDQDDSQRVATLADRVHTRLQNAITSGNLTSDQTVALKDAAAKFQSLMSRIGNADQTDESKRAVHFALHQLGQQIQAIFDAQDSSGAGASVSGASGSDIAAAITAPAVDTVA